MFGHSKGKRTGRFNNELLVSGQRYDENIQCLLVYGQRRSADTERMAKGIEHKIQHDITAQN